MRQSTGISWTIRVGAIAMLLPLLAVAACSSGDKAMADKLAAAEAAATRAEAAQHAAEKAAMEAANVHPAPPPPTVVSDFPSDDGDNESSSGGGDIGDASAPDHIAGGQVSMGGGPVISADGTVIPGG